MAIFIEAVDKNTLKACEYYKKPDLFNLVNYVLGSHCMGGYYLLLGIPMYGVTSEMIVNQFLEVRSRYGRENNGTLAHHFILSFSEQESKILSVSEIFIIAKQICDKYFEGKYAVIAMHENTNTLHLHFAINSASYANGNVLSKYPYLEKMIGNEVTDEIRRKSETLIETLDRM